MSLKTIIIDDDLMAIKYVEKLVEKKEELELISTFDDPQKGLEFLHNNQIDLLFLDIEMPGLTGIELIEQLTTLPQIIFTTGNRQYAYDAFEYDVTDFLKKPILPVRFEAAVEKAVARQEQLGKIASYSASHELYIRTDGRLIRLPYKEILYFENVGDYVKVITERGNHVIYGALKAIDEKLTHPCFLKVHRSFIINLDKVKDIEENTVVIEKKVIPISRAHKPILMNAINLLSF